MPGLRVGKIKQSLGNHFYKYQKLQRKGVEKMKTNNIRSSQNPTGLGTLLTSGMIAVASMFRGNTSAGNLGRRPKSRNDFPSQASWAVYLY